MQEQITIGLDQMSDMVQVFLWAKYLFFVLAVSLSGYGRERTTDGCRRLRRLARRLPCELMSTRIGSNEYLGCVASTTYEPAGKLLMRNLPSALHTHHAALMVLAIFQ